MKKVMTCSFIVIFHAQYKHWLENTIKETKIVTKDEETRAPGVHFGYQV